VIDGDSRLANDLSLAVMRLSRQLRFRRPQSPVSLSQLSALATLANFGPMTRVIASLAELGFVDRVAHPDDGRQVLVSVSETGAELMEAERQASQEWLTQRLETLGVAERDTLRVAADLILALVDESP
jgi:DNA-binding MarR family transcriptional regulator